MARRVGFALLLPLAISAQTGRGNITGLVTDPADAVIPAASILCMSVAKGTSFPARSNRAGEYNIAGLEPGEYRLMAAAPGFQSQVRKHVFLRGGATVRADFQLSLGENLEAMEVGASATQVQAGNAAVSSAVNNRLIDELPLVVGGNLRSPLDLAMITPETRGSGAGLSLGGGQAAAWDATLDGLSINTSRSANASDLAFITPSVEAITEFTIVTNGFNAEYGQAGGGAITFVSKSGGDTFHGSAYDFLRNDAFDARGFFAKTRSVYKQNDFGASLGGPVVRNKTFFFLAYEGFRNRVGANQTILSVPAPEMYQGDFSNWVDRSGKLLPVYDPAAPGRAPFPDNRIPASRFSAFSKTLIPYAAVVKPNRGGPPGTYSYIRDNYIVGSGAMLSPADRGSVRLDHAIRETHRLAFFLNQSRQSREPGPGGPPALPAPLADVQIQEYSNSLFRLSYDWAMTPGMLNHFVVGGYRYRRNSHSPATGLNWKDRACMKGVVDCSVNFPMVSFTEFSQWNGGADAGTHQPNWSVKDDFNVIRGAHTFKFGYAFEHLQGNATSRQTISGEADFSFLSTSAPGGTAGTSGSSFASFLLGDAIRGATETYRDVSQIFRYHGFYAQDDWRVTNRFTVNLGLRYEFTLPPVSPGDQYSDFTPDRPNPAVNGYPGALRFAGFGPGRENVRSLVPGWWGGIGPRLGVAYSPDSKTAVRAGFGRSFAKVNVINNAAHYAGFAGQYVFASPDQGLTPAFNWDSGLPPYALPPQLNPAFQNNQNVDYWQPQDAVRSPESLSWSFSVQRQITPNTLVEAAYNAVAGIHLQTGLVNINQTPTRYLNDFVRQYGAEAALALLRSDINSAAARAAGIPIPYPNFADPSVQQVRTVSQALRPFPQYQTIGTSDRGADKSGHSTYHAFVLKAERRFAAGLTFQWNYTLSKLLTDSDSYFTGPAAQDQYNRRLEKSIGQFDQTHALKLSTIYELPYGFRVSAIQTYASGLPVGVMRNNPLPIFNGPARPVVATYQGWRAPSGSGVFLNRAAFPAQPDAAFGNSTRFNPKVRSFPLSNENVSLAKAFRLRESMRLEFRCEAFNLFNRTVFGTGNLNLDSSDFGLITNQVNDPRQMQIAVKLYW